MVVPLSQSWNGTSILPPQAPGHCTYSDAWGRGERVHCGEKSGFTSSGQRHDISPKEMVVRKVIYEYPCIYGCGAHASLASFPGRFWWRRNALGTTNGSSRAPPKYCSRHQAHTLSSKLGIYGSHRPILARYCSHSSMRIYCSAILGWLMYGLSHRASSSEGSQSGRLMYCSEGSHILAR